ncbi:unnamed protein product [Meganyctiphanes norvegica]|uniref:Uncharacterized protein n=1 Tax=Meganyctiphanes norvegica TaxID=48144 RepID=A0AAV2S2B2_MEGNR
MKMLQTMITLVLLVVVFVPDCNGYHPKNLRKSIERSYEEDIQAEIDMFRDVLIDPKCSSALDDSEDWCPTMGDRYCDYGWIFGKCLKTCCEIPSFVNDTTVGCAKPCNGHSHCIETQNPEKPQLSHCEENSFTAVNLRPVITESMVEALYASSN